jgi:Papain-like cysteine protease AvrRpt2
MPIKIQYIQQPNPLVCQSACIAMVLGSDDVMGIREDLVSRGTAGDPGIMGEYLRPRAKSYQFLVDGSLNDAKKALDEGCTVITHGWFTRVGHVITLIGYEADPKTMSYRFVVHDPFAEYDFPNGDHDEAKTGEGVRYSSYGMYATCVASSDYHHAREIYGRKTLLSTEENAWLHIVKN